MGVTNYYTVGGEILGEATSGVRTDYLRDALGSVTGTVDATGHAQRSYSYKPYGSDLATSGTGSDPRFRWVGSQGYRDTGLAHASHYVRMRDYAKEEGRWTSVDPLLRFGAPPYTYCLLSPATYVDPSGLLTEQPTTLPPWIQPPSFDNCITLPGILLPLPPPLSEFLLTISGRLCIQAYDPSCCKPPGNYATACLTIGVRGTLSFVGLTLSDIELLERFNFNFLMSFIFGLGQLSSGTIPKKECKEKGLSVVATLCMNACFVVVSVSGCIFSVPPYGAFRIKGGYCGLPSDNISLTVDGTYCW